jgi:hypothetical protein
MITKKLFLPVLPMLLLCGSVTSIASAQDGNSPQTSAAVAASNVKHDATSEITVAGSIQQVSSEHKLGSPSGLHLLLNSPGGVLDASVGPYLSEDVRQALSAGQQVQIVGVIQTINGHNYLLAHQLVLAGREIPIRNEHGFFIHPQSGPGNRSLPAQNELKGGIR